MHSFVLSLILFLLSSPSVEAAVISNFDWDDNIVHMGSEVYLFHKNTGKQVSITTEDWAKYRDDFGKRGPWKDFEIRPGPGGTYRRMHSSRGANYFLEDIKKAVANGDWKGPAWEQFAEVLSQNEKAERLTIITARNHDPKDILEGLRYLQSEGFIKYLPRLENIHPVGGATDTSLAKVAVMRKYLEALNREPLENGSLHKWGFSDDDSKNYETALRELRADVNAGKYPNVEITLFFTDREEPEKNKISILQRDCSSFFRQL